MAKPAYQTAAQVEHQKFGLGSVVTCTEELIVIKFDDHVVYDRERVSHAIHVVLRVLSGHAKERLIIFSSFNPDAALLVRTLQNKYAVRSSLILL